MMKKMRITQAFTADRHFEPAGFSTHIEMAIKGTGSI
jgi:hypothetical protein